MTTMEYRGFSNVAVVSMFDDSTGLWLVLKCTANVKDLKYLTLCMYLKRVNYAISHLNVATICNSAKKEKISV